ncbi:hypothetical protein B5807_00047 [Epicoccum nigrum]|uniref:Uncharacterized protein n=1 Tax=Epicoccum nigrum TaxID=105696 RepID=A0A1Y2MDK2_EPING|nr:hypothetical protein B5807_00047 [Epicoccum nigrum]
MDLKDTSWKDPDSDMAVSSSDIHNPAGDGSRDVAPLTEIQTFDLTLWEKLPEEIRRNILDDALYDYLGTWWLAEQDVQDAVSRMDEPHEYALICLPASMHTLEHARKIIYNRNLVQIKYDDKDPSANIRYPKRSYNGHIKSLLVVVGAFENHLRFLQRLANGELGFAALEDVRIDICLDTLWDTADVNRIKAMQKLFSDTKVVFKTEFLKLMISPSMQRHKWHSDDFDDATFQTAYEGMKAIATSIPKIFTISRPDLKMKLKRFWSERAAKRGQRELNMYYDESRWEGL